MVRSDVLQPTIDARTICVESSLIYAPPIVMKIHLFINIILRFCDLQTGIVCRRGSGNKN